MSVANTLMPSGLRARSASSTSSMASVYASSPLEQAVTQARTSLSGSRRATSGAITFCRIASHASASRKKPVTWISRSSASDRTSPGLCRSSRAYSPMSVVRASPMRRWMRRSSVGFL
jgi:hypothetical protein